MDSTTGVVTAGPLCLSHGQEFGWYLPEIFVLKIELAHGDPLIWRRVEVDSGLSLHDLHYVIQSVFEWTNSHLYQFLVPRGE